jgi:hypothetical protein
VLAGVAAGWAASAALDGVGAAAAGEDGLAGARESAEGVTASRAGRGDAGADVVTAPGPGVNQPGFSASDSGDASSGGKLDVIDGRSDVTWAGAEVAAESDAAADGEIRAAVSGAAVALAAVSGAGAAAGADAGAAAGLVWVELGTAAAAIFASVCSPVDRGRRAGTVSAVGVEGDPTVAAARGGCVGADERT